MKVIKETGYVEISPNTSEIHILNMQTVNTYPNKYCLDMHKFETMLKKLQMSVYIETQKLKPIVLSMAQ